MTADPAIAAHKSLFLRTQIRQLGTPLLLPSSNSSIPNATLEKIVEASNKKITAYNRLHFPIESQSAIVEQLDTLYFNEATADGLPSRRAETCVKREIDLTDIHNGVRTMPALWKDVTLDESGRTRKRRRLAEQNKPTAGNDSSLPNIEEGSDNEVDDGENYEQLHVRLGAQIDRRDQLRRKLEQLKKLQALLEPFEDPKVDVQPNLVTKDNTELESELSRMRILMAKVGSGLQRQKLIPDPGDPNEMAQSDKERLDQLLNL